MTKWLSTELTTIFTSTQKIYRGTGYPFWWLRYFWPLLRSQRRRGARVACASGTVTRILALVRMSESKSDFTLNVDSNVQQLLIERLGEQFPQATICIWNSQVLGAPSLVMLFRFVLQRFSKSIILVSVDSLSAKLFYLPIKSHIFSISLYLTRRNTKVFCLAWDAMDPLETFSADRLTRFNGCVLFLGTFGKTMASLGVRNAWGPSAELTSPPLSPDVVSSEEWDSRSIDVYFPPKSKHFRNKTLEPASRSLEERGYVISSLMGRTLEYNKYLGHLAESKICIVLNRINPKYLELATEAKIGLFPTRHIVGRNLEVVSSKSLLFSEKCDEMYLYFTPGVDFVEWTNPTELVELVSYFLESPDKAIKLIDSASKKLADILVRSPTLSLIKNFELNADRLHRHSNGFD